MPIQADVSKFLCIPAFVLCKFIIKALWISSCGSSSPSPVNVEPYVPTPTPPPPVLKPTSKQDKLNNKVNIEIEILVALYI